MTSSLADVCPHLHQVIDGSCADCEAAPLTVERDELRAKLADLEAKVSRLREAWNDPQNDYLLAGPIWIALDALIGRDP